MIRKFLIPFIALVLVAAAPSSFAQTAAQKASEKAGPNIMTGGFGVTWIDGEPYYALSLAPEVSFGKVGVGLDLNFYISSKDQSIRWQELQYGRFIRYLRYGQKNEDLYARLGILDNTRLGHGFIMYLYKNSPSHDARRIGAEFDLNFGKYGFESMYSDFARSGVVGIRPYVKPLQYTTLAKVPVIGGLEVGASWVSDFRTDSKTTKVNVTPSAVSGAPPTIAAGNDGTMNVIGADIGLPLVRIPTISSTFYTDYAKIISYGSGVALGLETNFSGMGLLEIFTKIERRYSGDNFMPNYFDSFYELDRVRLNDTMYISKAHQLDSVKSPGWGYFADLTISILGTVDVRGMFQKLDNDPHSGMLHLGTSLGKMVPMVVVDAGYDKRMIKSGKDLFTLDERSLLYVEVGYKPYPFMTVSTLYTWTFAPVTDVSGNISYVPQKRVTPRVTISFPL